MRLVVAVSIVSMALMGAEPVPAPNEQCETLLSSVIPFAEKMLTEHGEFYPFGATMKIDGSVALAAADDGTARPFSNPLIKMLRDGFVAQAKDGTIVASALAYDVRVIPPGATEKKDAVAVELDHREHYSVVVFFPYTLKDGKATIEPAFTNVGQYAIFPRKGG
jgi:hypothetical protein